MAHDPHGDHDRDRDHDRNRDHDLDRDRGLDRGLDRGGPEPLREGEGDGKILFLDAPSGLSGDMTIAALLDLGTPLEVVERAVGGLPVRGVRLRRGRTRRSGIAATTFEVIVEGPQPERTHAAIDDMLAAAQMRPGARDRARAVFRRLAEAEAEVHGIRVADVHFHEVGAVDAIVDVVGAAACFDYLGAEVVASPLPMGRGFVRARHGVLPLPAPATVACLRGVPTYGADVEAELVTPTGAAIVATVAARFEGWPAIAPARVGHGAGARDLPDRPNVLRAVLGDPREPAAGGAGPTHVVLEANVDDMTGELAAHAIGALLHAGALDAWAAPVTMKKGRPGLVVSAIAPLEAERAVAEALLRETTTIGLRRTAVTRAERPRRTVEVATPFGRIPVKIAAGPWGPPQVKPEFDACARAAERSAVPVREVIAAALDAARDALRDRNDERDG